MFKPMQPVDIVSTGDLIEPDVWWTDVNVDEPASLEPQSHKPPIAVSVPTPGEARS